jgi:hypothetical protein
MLSTGVKGLDRIITGLREGDNVVWQIDDIDDYIALAVPFVENAVKENRTVVYMRFASHKEILKPSENIIRYELDAHQGFEPFSTKVHSIIAKHGEGAYYVFDCLSGLLSAWATDLMIGNFFMISCPYLYELKTIAYFSIMRNSHSFDSIARIRETTQILIDAYHCQGMLYLHPLKVWNRYSPTMFLPHQKEEDDFLPVTDSLSASKIFSHIKDMGSVSVKRNLDYWDRLFMDAAQLLLEEAGPQQIRETIDMLSSVMVTRNKQIHDLIVKYFSLEELLGIKSRLVGTGFVGGKTAGMLLARKMLMQSKRLNWKKLEEPHDSFYIGSDIFYSYIVQNKWWKLRMMQKTEDGYIPMAEILRNKMLHGTFSQDIMESFQQIVEYFGSSPIIIRSSSLLEDGFGNAFAGKYESIFLASQGSPEQRYIEFADVVRRVYASTMSEDALVYRKQRGLDKMDEQMALLVQRVSGSRRGNVFFPDVAGVGLSYNTYVWNERIEPESGILRLVCGLGTRAVNRVDGDYPVMAALSEPLIRPYLDKGDEKRFSQHNIDVISTEKNQLVTMAFEDIIGSQLYEHIQKIATRDLESEQKALQLLGAKKQYWTITFKELLKDNIFLASFKSMLKALEKGYDYPVEIEFTLNFTEKGSIRINLLQCRPLQRYGAAESVYMPGKINSKDILFSSKGHFLGGNISQKIDKIVYVNPKKYTELCQSDKYDIARSIGRINNAIKDSQQESVLLIGPGRWGTSTPSLGVPVSFSEINNIRVMAEVAFPEGHLMPELSFGTHFFQDLVETGIFYIALFPGKKGVLFSEKWFDRFKNISADIFKQPGKISDCIRVYDFKGMDVRIISDIVSQKVICFRDGPQAQVSVLKDRP